MRNLQKEDSILDLSCKKEDIIMNYKKLEVGKLSNIINRENGKVFLHDSLQLSSCEISINCVPKDFALPFSHKHKQNEEIYIFLKGDGIMTVDGNEVKVTEGDCVKIMPDGARTLKSIGDTELEFICIQAKTDSLKQFGMGDAQLC